MLHTGAQYYREAFVHVESCSKAALAPHRGSFAGIVAGGRASSSESNLYSARAIAEVRADRCGAKRRCTTERNRRRRGTRNFARSRSRSANDVHRFTQWRHLADDQRRHDLDATDQQSGFAVDRQPVARPDRSNGGTFNLPRAIRTG
jgi:hypothetical protein